MTSPNITHDAVAPLTPLAGYIGGKRSLAKLLIPKIDATPHTLYCEAFVGLGGIFLRRKHRAKVEAINDYASDVATLFRVVQHHPQALIDDLRWGLASREAFGRLVRTDPAQLTDVQRAARFIQLQSMGFGGKVASRVFGIASERCAKFNPQKLMASITALHARLAGVYVEHLPWREFIERWDRPGALFYLDPPYYGVEGYYGPIFKRSEFEQLSSTLKELKGRFILSLNDHPEVRRIFAWAKIEEAALTYCCSGKPTAAREMIITAP